MCLYSPLLFQIIYTYVTSFAPQNNSQSLALQLVSPLCRYSYFKNLGTCSSSERARIPEFIPADSQNWSLINIWKLIWYKLLCWGTFLFLSTKNVNCEKHGDSNNNCSSIWESDAILYINKFCTSPSSDFQWGDSDFRELSGFPGK